MSNTFYVVYKEDDLKHHGVLGMKWGVRKYQNANGTLTSAGKARYNKSKNSKNSNIKMNGNKKPHTSPPGWKGPNSNPDEYFYGNDGSYVQKDYLRELAQAHNDDDWYRFVTWYKMLGYEDRKTAWSYIPQDNIPAIQFYLRALSSDEFNYDENRPSDIGPYEQRDRNLLNQMFNKEYKKARRKLK